MPAAPHEDAALMAASQLVVPDTKDKNNKAGQSDTAHASSSATNALARSNLLRLETSELLQESFLHIHPTGDANNAHYEAKWAPSVRSYLTQVKEVIANLGEATLGPDVAKLASPGSKGGNVKEKGMEHVLTNSEGWYKISHPFAFR